MKHLSSSLRLAAFLTAGVCWVAHADSVYENYTFTTLAGLGFASRDGSNNVALFNSPSGVTVDGAGNVYVADTGNDTLRKILPVGRVATVAGLAGSSGSADGTGGGAQFNQPRKAAADTRERIDFRAEFLRNLHRAVGRAGIHDDELRREAAHGLQALREKFFLVLCNQADRES